MSVGKRGVTVGRWLLEYPVVLLVALLCFHFGMNLWWLAADNHTVRTDEEGHMHMARTHYEALTQPGSLPDHIIALSEIKLGNPAHPPLLHLVGAAMIVIFGYSIDTLALTGSFLFILVLLGCYRIARTFLTAWQSLFVTFVVSFTPLIFVASRYFMTDYLSLALVVWGIYALIRSEGFSRTPWVFLFAVLGGLGILTRPTHGIYLFFPTLLVMAVGCFQLWRMRADRMAAFQRLRTVCFNLILCAVVGFGVSAPWYFHHFKGFYEFWAYSPSHGQNPIAVFDESKKLKKATKTSPTSKAFSQEKPIFQPSPKTKSGFVAKTVALCSSAFHPQLPWRRYAVFIINNGIFLPVFLLSCIGLFSVFWRRSYASLPFFLCYAWWFGAWILLTILFRFGIPRYTLQFMPAVAFFAALAVLSLPGRRMRWGAAILLGLLLLFQYGNLTVHAYGSMAQAYVPCNVDPFTQRIYDEPGLACYRDRLGIGDAYEFLSAPQKENYKDRLFQAMTAHEHANKPYLSGGYAHYVRVNLRGMEFDEQHYWCDSPYRRKDIAPEDFPPRRFKVLAQVSTPQAGVGFLANADYVLYAINSAFSAQEAGWRKFLEMKGYELVDHWLAPRRGRVEARNYGVYGRKFKAKAPKITTQDDIDKLDLMGLYQLTRSNLIQALPTTLQTYAQNRFAGIMRQYSQPTPINEYVDYRGAFAKHLEGDWYEFNLVFFVHRPIEKDWRMYFHGHVKDEHRNVLPKRCQKQGYVDWNFQPNPPTSLWPAGDYVIITHRIDAQKIPYRLRLGLFSNKDGFFGNGVELGWVDMGNVS